MNEHESRRLDFELPNVGQGSDTVQSASLAAGGECLLVVLLGSHYCSRSRELVRTLAENCEEFRARSTTVVPVLPDIRERARVWDRQYDLPFPLLADPAADADGPDEFGAFGPLQRAVDGLPAFVLCTAADGTLRVDSTETEATLDVPLVDSVLEFVDRNRAVGSEVPSTNAPADS
ncbi:redoxin domain-containing protein [Haloarcula sp. S1CR25-12]|uniref:Redoxin domain-containing protein n=1 Tax=Haloarcula saliterrae TaxID=2950534 RepID=A0ABU2FD97_9EURY|nr:redoxin domain-containing protein [Haloarcula sp. S1CR25-12]MDS0260214.1 redoxin domain-containing protein [Haloarcula sp. S1CR25-12]